VSFDPNDLIRLKNRLKNIELEQAKLEERKTIATAQLKAAREELKKLGFDSKTAEQEIESLYSECITIIDELEEILEI